MRNNPGIPLASLFYSCFFEAKSLKNESWPRFFASFSSMEKEGKGKSATESELKVKGYS